MYPFAPFFLICSCICLILGKLLWEILEVAFQDHTSLIGPCGLNSGGSGYLEALQNSNTNFYYL